MHPVPANLLSLVNPVFGAWRVKTADRTLMSHSTEDNLLFGHAFSDREARTAGRRIAGQSDLEVDRSGDSQARSPRIYWRGR